MFFFFFLYSIQTYYEVSYSILNVPYMYEYTQVGTVLYTETRSLSFIQTARLYCTPHITHRNSMERANRVLKITRKAPTFITQKNSRPYISATTTHD